MKFISFFFCIVFCISSAHAQEQVKIYSEVVDGGYNLYADNDEYCPVSIKLDFTVKHLKLADKNNSVFVLNPRENRQLITTLTPEPNRSHEFRYTVWFAYGDVEDDTYDRNYPYSLPYAQNTSHIIDQGYDGRFSHQDQYALDFDFDKGTEIYAIRAGTVIEVVENNNRNCLNASCQKYNNVILVYHSDGTIADYAHIKKNGSVVSEGDKIKQGQLIGYSGNTGWSSAPHLHLSIFKARLDGQETLKTKFKTGNGETIEYLKEGQEYSRNY